MIPLLNSEIELKENVGEEDFSPLTWTWLFSLETRIY
jgi:hypothetical protein